MLQKKKPSKRKMHGAVITLPTANIMLKIFTQKMEIGYSHKEPTSTFPMA